VQVKKDQYLAESNSPMKKVTTCDSLRWLGLSKIFYEQFLNFVF